MVKIFPFDPPEVWEIKPLVVPYKTPVLVVYAADVISPLFPIVNLVAPALEAVNKSPTPELSITMVAKEVLPDTLATLSVPAPSVSAVSLNLADEEAELPNKKSRVGLYKLTTPLLTFQVLSPVKQVTVVQTIPDVGRVSDVSPLVVKVRLLAPILRVLESAPAKVRELLNATDFELRFKEPVPVAIVFPLIVAAVRVEVFKTLESTVKAVTVPVRPLTANFADAVVLPPIANESKLSSGLTKLLLFCQKLYALVQFPVMSQT
jgi:hypothetical protein